MRSKKVLKSTTEALAPAEINGPEQVRSRSDYFRIKICFCSDQGANFFVDTLQQQELSSEVSIRLAQQFLRKKIINFTNFVLCYELYICHENLCISIPKRDRSLKILTQANKTMGYMFYVQNNLPGGPLHCLKLNLIHVLF